MTGQAGGRQSVETVQLCRDNLKNDSLQIVGWSDCCATFATAKKEDKRGRLKKLIVGNEREKNTDYAGRGFGMQIDGRSMVVDEFVCSTPKSGGDLLCVESGR